LTGMPAKSRAARFLRYRCERYCRYLNDPELEPKIRAIPLSIRSRIGSIEVILEERLCPLIILSLWVARDSG
jgi:hypothetical protein